MKWFVRCWGWSLVGVLCACGGSGSGDGDDAGFTPFPMASLVVGQPGFSTRDINRGLPTATAQGLANPAGCALDADHLLIADLANNRILGFGGPPDASDPPADFAIGQPDLLSNTPGLAANRLDSPRAVHLSNGRVFVADTRNNRVLIWNVVPQADEPADVVLGQSGLGTNAAGVGPDGMEFPSDVWVAGGKLFVADAANNRVLIWNAVPTVSGTGADVVLGQLDMNAKGVSTASTGMDNPASVWSDGTRMVVSDGSNNRVLIWHAIPAANGTPADLVLGQPGFGTNASGAGRGGMNAPRGAMGDGTRLLVADASNHRILIFSTFPTQSAEAASGVIGQSNFTNTQPNDDNQDGFTDVVPSSRTLNFPNRLAGFDGRLYVPEFFNHRLVVFQP